MATRPKINDLHERICTAASLAHLRDHNTLAKALGMSQASGSQVHRWLVGESEPTLYYLAEMAKLFRCSTDYLLGLTNYPKGNAP